MGGIRTVAPRLAATPLRWRPLLATVIYSGLRKGELLGLRKSDVDLASRLIMVSPSYDREATKGGQAEAIPIAQELVVYLRAAIKASDSDLVFPDPRGRAIFHFLAMGEVSARCLDAPPLGDASVFPNMSQPWASAPPSIAWQVLLPAVPRRLANLSDL